MWNNTPPDILAYIFSLLSPDSLARAKAVSKHWHTCVEAYMLVAAPSEGQHRQPPWFTAFPARNYGSMSCYVHSPGAYSWYVLPLDFVPGPHRLIGTVSGLVLSRSCRFTNLQLAIFNPFTRQYRQLPGLNVNRTNPAVGIVKLGSVPGPNPVSPLLPRFQVYVAGGMSSMPQGAAATYVPTVEMYESTSNTWQVVGPMPMEFAVRLTVWTSNESVYLDGHLYWITSAQAYTIMGFDVGSKKCVELRVPLADKLELATLVRRNGKLTLVGATCHNGACVWELGVNLNWNMVASVPTELGRKFLGQKDSWSGTKCVGVDGVICLYKELRSGMLVWRENVAKGLWEWFWIDGFNSVKGKGVSTSSIRGLLLYPNLSMCL